jgi:predicted permease
MSWTRRFANLLRSNRHARDIDRELAFHVGERADDLVAAGMTRELAEHEARRRFGNYGAQKEKTRDAGIFTWLDAMIDDTRYAIRMLRHSPAFTLVTVLSLALGIGANTAIFTLINAVMLRSLPVAHPEELVQLTMPGGQQSFTNPVWEQIRDNQKTFSGAFAYSTMRFNLVTSGEVRYAAGNLVSGDYFRTLGVQPALGRLLSVADDQRGCPSIVVLSEAFWRSAYGGELGVLGKTISLNTRAFQIVGVAQAGFAGLEVGRGTQVFAPICAEPVFRGPNTFLDQRSAWWLTLMARTRPGADPTQVQIALNALAAQAFAATVPQRLRPEQQRNYLKNTLAAAPAAHGVSDLRQKYRRALVVLMVIVGLVLLIACANVANLLLARAAVRRREIAIRVALGAARSRVIRQLLTESVLLSTLGALLGLAVARWGSRLLVTFLSPAGRPIFLDLRLDAMVLWFSVGIAVLTGLAFGLAPAWRAARVAPNAALKANARGIVEGHGRLTAGKALVVAQLAISLTLIIGAGLLLGTFRRISTLDAGFDPADVLIVSLDKPRSGKSNAQQHNEKTAMLERIRSMSGVTSASLSQLTPLGNSSWNEEMVIDGFTPKSDDDAIAFFNEVSDGYFRTMGTPLLVGRDFDGNDRVGTLAVAIINETMARRFYGASNPVGKSFRYRVGTGVSNPIQVIGMVKDAKYQSLREKTLPTAFVPLAQNAELGSDIYLEARIPSGAAAAIPSVKSALEGVDATFQTGFIPFATQVANSLTAERLLASLSAFFGTLALLLATMGLYGVMAYSVARRRNEIGIRMALGAGQRRVARMVVGEVSTLIVIGFVLGVALSLASTRLISTFLFGLKPTDVATFAGSMALLATVALLAAYVPARRAARTDPMEALREE